MRSLSIIIPAYNEERRLPGTLENIVRYIQALEPGTVDVLIVDDGSTDGTADLVRSYAREHPAIRLLSNPGNRGKGYSVRHGMLAAQQEWALFSDADLSTPLEDVDRLCAAVEQRNAAIAIGSRALDRSLVGVHQSSFREYSGRFFNIVMRLITGLTFRDTQCGFKLYRRDAREAVFSRQLLDGFSFDVEDLFIARKLGISAVEVPVRWNNVEGTKVSAGEGLKSFTDLWRIFWNDKRGRYAS